MHKFQNFFYSWLFPSEHHHTTQTSKFNHFFNGASTMLNNVYKLSANLFAFSWVFCFLSTTSSKHTCTCTTASTLCISSWEPEGCHHNRLCTAIAPFWLSMEHHWHWAALTPFWLSTDDVQTIHVHVGPMCTCIFFLNHRTWKYHTSPTATRPKFHLVMKTLFNIWLQNNWYSKMACLRFFKCQIITKMRAQL